MSSRPITSTATAPARRARISRAPAATAGTAARAGVDAATLSAARIAVTPNLFGTSAQLTKDAGPRTPPDAPAPGAAMNTATLPVNAAGSSMTAVSPQVPANTAGTPFSSALPPKPFCAVGTVGIQSRLDTSAAPPICSDDVLLSNCVGPKGRVWKYVPLSPAGLRPTRLNSRAMYSVPLKFPFSPMRRPCIESSANW